MIRPINIIDLLKLDGAAIVLDVRTPAEFAHGHIRGAHNLPLFSNEERVQVGTTYKQVGREQAILLGFDIAGPKWSRFIRQALHIAPEKKVIIHCWRGGMRSGAMAWALDLYGFDVQVIKGGYKSYRRWAHQQFEVPYKLSLLGGMTGAGKTRILHQLNDMGEQVLDLEDLAQHQGSSYGTMNKMVQPTQEQFENNMALQLSKMDAQGRIWVEDESITIGRCSIPRPLWQQMCDTVLINILVAQEQRVHALSEEYGQLDKDFLVTCTERIHKRLGTERTKLAIAAIQENRMNDFIRHVLVYYDKAYAMGLEKRSASKLFQLNITGKDTVADAKQILKLMNTIPVTEQA